VEVSDTASEARPASGYPERVPRPSVTAAAQQRAAALGEALHQLRPLSPAYATLPILEGFNVAECLASVEEGQWYLVVFRSVRAAGADEAVLTEFDDRAHQEALAASGLLHYFRGELNERRECLSMCLWESPGQAQHAARLPLHHAAVAIASAMYESFTLERYLLTKRRGVAGLSMFPLPAVRPPSASFDA
jgi:hypothetical protein